MKVTAYGLKSKFTETNPSDILLYHSINDLLYYPDERYCIELYDVFLYEIGEEESSYIFNGNTLKNVIDNNINYTETKMPENVIANSVFSIMKYTYFQNITSLEDLTKNIRLHFIHSLKMLKFSETFSIILYEKYMKYTSTGKIPFWYRSKMSDILNYIIAILSEKLSKDMQVYLILKEIENLK
jgi:hypothetical protein